MSQRQKIRLFAEDYVTSPDHTKAQLFVDSLVPGGALTTKRNVMVFLKKQVIDLLPPNTFFMATTDDASDDGKMKLLSGLSRTNQIKMQRYLLQRARSGEAVLSPVEAKFCALKLVPDFVQKITLADEDRAALKSRTIININHRSENAITVPSSSVTFILKRAQENIRSLDDTYSVLWSVALVSGRRASELLKNRSDLSFTKIHGFPWAASFSGQRKRAIGSEAVYSIPLMTDHDEFIGALRYLNDHYYSDSGTTTPLSADKIHSRFSYETIAATKKLKLEAGIEDPAIHFHTIRAMYACISFALVQNQYSLHGWIRRVLGHQDLNDSKSYSIFKWSGQLDSLPEYGAKMPP